MTTFNLLAPASIQARDVVNTAAALEGVMRRTLGAALLMACAVAPVGTQSTDDFRWVGAVARGKTIEVKGVNGHIRAELATGSQVEVTAVKRARQSDPATVSFEVVQEDGNVTICAMYPTPNRRSNRSHGPNECRPGARGHMDTDHNDVRVDFVVKVPAGVRYAGKTVNGSITAQGLRGEAHARTVNGRIDLSTSDIGSAHTVNGGITAELGGSKWTGELEFSTVNGSIALSLPKDTDTNVRAQTMNGRFDSDFPLLVKSFRARNRRVVGTIGDGGRELALTTVNGSIDLRFITRQ